MEIAHSTAKLTYADYLRFPDDNLRHEIIAGEHHVSPSPATIHQRIAGNLYVLLRLHLEKHPVGEVFIAPFDALLSTFDIVVPDLMYLSHERAQYLGEKNLQGPPDLVVEILSPGSRRRDLHLKRELYERVGVLEYWIVDPRSNSIAAHRRGNGGFDAPLMISSATSNTLTTPLLPELQLPLDSIFPR